ncbi:hypothetical protein [Caedibacter taeniospiralis]|uniref:hypothetical protein n=1 Tax=Caedibacter taeniospiralis TaxID=28907 RepID=UPI000C27AE9A|nr:hypothetical protein [Caedibacter taeniospiralis]
MENVRLNTEVIALKQQTTQLNLLLLSMQKSYDQVTLAYLKTQAESKQANAIAYSLNNWQELTRYVEHGRAHR